MVYRVYVEKKEGFDTEARSVESELRNFLMIKLKGLRIVNRYDCEGIGENDFLRAVKLVFSQPQTDRTYFTFDEVMNRGDANITSHSSEVYYSLNELRIDGACACGDVAKNSNENVVAVRYLDGQFDSRADAAEACVEIITKGARPVIRTAKLYIIEGELKPKELAAVKKYLINPVECREAELKKPDSLEIQRLEPKNVASVELIEKTDEELDKLRIKSGFAMDLDDLRFCRDYFTKEGRNPTATELKVIDTYWSDHCRHTTFLTNIESVKFEDELVQRAYEEYLRIRERAGVKKPICLMDLATVCAKDLKKRGLLKNVEQSEEINACSVNVKVNTPEGAQDWLLLFKNETHNHPTEIEPFGGAATCIGGAIRDPLSSRAYVFAAMRVTGAANPTERVKDTIKGKLPQRKLVVGASDGYSSYGNQIGLATGIVNEIYHAGYKAKHMEIGAVLGAVKRGDIVREKPTCGDVVLLLGGKTGRDGCGGATGSSKSHSTASIEVCGAEVQKGNAPEERKLQRFFRNPSVTRLIKRCNDFGAGGISVAIGELAEGLDINLDRVPKKYDGLDGTELAISESQERMAVVVAVENVEIMMKLANEENILATRVAEVTDSNRLQMKWRGDLIVDLSRDFLDSNGAPKHIDVEVEKHSDFDRKAENDFEMGFFDCVTDLNVCSMRGLGEKFDCSIGAGTVLNAFGGKRCKTPIQAMVHLMPVKDCKTTTCSAMSWGFNPFISEKSPFHAAHAAVYDSIAKLCAVGCGKEEMHLTFQEYFEKLGSDGSKWGKPLAALLGALRAQEELNVAAIGGKDSMSGSFERLSVPPTLVSFAVSTLDVSRVTSPEFKKAGSKVFLLKTPRTADGLLDAAAFKANAAALREGIESNKVLSAYAVGFGGIAEAVFKCAIGNGYGFEFCENVCNDDLFGYGYGSFMVEIDGDLPCAEENGIVMQSKTPDCNFEKNAENAEVLPDYKAGEGEVAPNSKQVGNAEALLDLKAGEGEAMQSARTGERAKLHPIYIGTVRQKAVIIKGEDEITLAALEKAYEGVLEGVYPTTVAPNKEKIPHIAFDGRAANGVDSSDIGLGGVKASEIQTSLASGNGLGMKDVAEETVIQTVLSSKAEQNAPSGAYAKPRVVVPVFPGTNCEYDIIRRLEKAGFITQTFVVNNLSGEGVKQSVGEFARLLGNSQAMVLSGGFSCGDEPDGSGKFIAAFLRNPDIAERISDLLNRKGLICGICNGFQALVKLGLLPFGKIVEPLADYPMLSENIIDRHQAKLVDVRVASTLSPWFKRVNVGEIYSIPISHGEGRFTANAAALAEMVQNGQIATQYVDSNGLPTYDIEYNPNGSIYAIEGITSPCGRILGRMGHSERIGDSLYLNRKGNYDMQIFEAAFDYFK
ncbi:MAG: phosphoribosylformylglycinamidine synthase [Clostridia bacterium]|nr:phosphoribosylformylglycinamidine synthase [Clostridia bacterium]